MSETPNILVIDDDATFNRVLCRALKSRGYDVASALSAQEALALIPSARAARAVLDLNIAGTSGLSLVAPLLAANPECRIVVLTGYASITTAVEAIKLGAAHYLAKPTDMDAILAAFPRRLAQDRRTEITTALEEIAKIAKLRLEDAVT